MTQHNSNLFTVGAERAHTQTKQLQSWQIMGRAWLGEDRAPHVRLPNDNNGGHV